MNNEIELDQIVLCTVDKIVGTTIFVKIDGNGEGTITTSEIAPGRIRNLRDYVIPGKKIVCKVLSIKGDKIHLSLRRVKQNEKKELLELISKDKSYKAIFKTVLKDKTEKTLEEIEKNYSLSKFLDLIKEDRKILEKFLSKSDSEKILKILDTKKEKQKEIKNIINLSNDSSQGIKIVKNILENSIKNSKCHVSYIAAGKYRLSITGNDFKNIKNNMNKIIEDIEKSAKKQNSHFEILKN